MRQYLNVEITLGQKFELLKRIDLLSFLNDETIMRLCAHCREIVLEPEEVLFREGTLETAMYLILVGDLMIYKGFKQIVMLGPGQYLGEMSLIESKPRSASAKALSASLLLEITEKQFNEYFATQPQALLSIIRTLCSRIRNDLNVMANDLQKVNIFTHDIKNCLTPLGLVELFMEESKERFEGTSEGQKKRAGLDDLEKSLEVMIIVRKNLTTMVNLSLSHAKKIKLDYIKKKEDILKVIRETTEQVPCHKYLKGKTLFVKTEGEPGDAYFNYLDIKRVLQNLLINAGYATPENGVIEICVKRENDSTHVSVVDYGCGIPEEIQPLLLKASLTTKGDDGNGLGLISCRDIIEQHHQGKLWFESKVGKGTTFHFTIPNENGSEP